MKVPRSAEPVAHAVRLGGRGDAESLARLHARAFDPGWDAESLASLIAYDGARVFVVDGAGDGPAGFILTWRAADEAEFLTLAVAPDRRRQGIAKALLSETIRQARTDGAARILLEVAASDEAAIRLYLSAGFVETGRRPEYYHGPGSKAEDALVLRLTL